jgi:hypothetical protein
MHTEPAIQPPASPAAGTVPEPMRITRHPAHSVLGKVMSALRGDKYLAGAYPPDWAASSTRSAEVPPSQER